MAAHARKVTQAAIIFVRWSACFRMRTSACEDKWMHKRGDNPIAAVERLPLNNTLHDRRHTPCSTIITFETLSSGIALRRCAQLTCPVSAALHVSFYSIPITHSRSLRCERTCKAVNQEYLLPRIPVALMDAGVGVATYGIQCSRSCLGPQLTSPPELYIEHPH
ncbi:hypothetical protein BV25DRAFT_1831005 [Artomyces pyxidatus]|uniref:Uncharacterized protein n=1 Tax=Artomyces pyxidatus TaxID=48021 RepID=A0ACB8SMV5_9AGAM|nr:hypothetical protein BV25DRAFT_1831005 [Artomyces pyxidatus]